MRYSRAHRDTQDYGWRLSLTCNGGSRGGAWGGPGPLLFLDQTEARRVDPPPPPPHLSQGLDLSSDHLKFSDRICNWPLSGYCMAAIITPFVDLNDFFRYFKSWEAMNLTSSAYLEVMSKLVNMFFFFIVIVTFVSFFDCFSLTCYRFP